MAAGLILNRTCLYGTTMQSELLEAARLGNTERVRQLLQNGADVNLSTHEGTPLMAASLSGSAELVELFLDNGADPDREDLSGNRPLIAAVKAWDLEIVELLLDRGADVNARDRKTGSSRDLLGR